MTIRNLSHTVRSRFPELVMGACVLGFAFLLAELISYDHYREGTQIVGFVATIVGLVLSGLAFLRGRMIQNVVLALLGLLSLVGLFGIIEHREARLEDAAKFAQRQAAGQAGTGAAGTAQPSAAAPATGATASSTTAGQQTPAGFKPGSDIPVLAPLSLSGLAGLAFLALLARRPDDGPRPARRSGEVLG